MARLSAACAALTITTYSVYILFQPTVPVVVKPGAITSKLPDLPALVEAGILTPGKDVLAVHSQVGSIIAYIQYLSE